MKVSILFLLSICFISSCFLFSDNYRLVGTWELVEGFCESPEGIFRYPSKYGQHQKIFTVDDFFVTVWQDTSNNPGSIYPGFNSGKFTLRGNFYTEHHEFNSDYSSIGKNSYFKIKFDGSNSFSIDQVDENGNDIPGYFEKWEKVQ